MLFKSEAYIQSLGDAEHARLFASHSPVGYHPKTHDRLLVPMKDRFAGMYILGVQGVGKSGLLENLIAHDIELGQPVIVIDPHGDLTTHSIARLPKDKLPKTFLMEMEDEAFPFGVNVFSGLTGSSAVAQAIDRVMHCFEVLWPDVLTQQHLPRFVRAATIALFANPGSTLVDMHAFLLDDKVRKGMLQAVRDPSVRQFWQYYDSLPVIDRRQQVTPLINRLESMFMGRSLVRNIVGQWETSIDFRSAIEERQIIFIRLPLKTLRMRG